MGAEEALWETVRAAGDQAVVAAERLAGYLAGSDPPGSGTAEALAWALLDGAAALADVVRQLPRPAPQAE